MANLKISQLPDASQLQYSDILPVVQNSGMEYVTAKTTVGALRDRVASPYFTHSAQNPQNVYSIVNWGEMPNQETMRFYGWGFNSGNSQNPTEFEYAWGAYFNHKFERMATGYKKNRWEHFTDQNISLYQGGTAEYWANNQDIDGVRVLYSDSYITELSVRDYNTNNQRKILSAGLHNNDNYTILNGSYSSVYDPLNPMANAHPLLKAGTYNGGYMMLCGKNGQPLLGQAPLGVPTTSHNGLYDFSGNKVAILSGGNMQIQNKLYAKLYGNVVDVDSDATFINNSNCGFGYTNSSSLKPSVANNPCAFVSLSNGLNNAQLMVERNTGRVFLRYHNGTSYQFKEFQLTAI